MCLLKNIALGLTLAATLSSPAFATPITQSTSPVSYSSYSGWHNDLLSSITFASHTVDVSALTGVATIKDQGWGGQDPNGNQIYIGLFDNNSQLWGQHFAGGFHNWTTQNYDISTDPNALQALNTALGSIDWSTDPTVTLQLRSSTIGYPGWQLFVQNAAFSVTSDVPEPASLALLGLGLAAVAASRRKRAK